MKKKIIEEVLNKKLTYLNAEALEELITEVDRSEERRVGKECRL